VSYTFVNLSFYWLIFIKVYLLLFSIADTKKMTEATTTVTKVPLTTIDNLFSITHQLFDEYRTAIFIVTGTSMAYFSKAYS
jgi:hypothetical protein